MVTQIELFESPELTPLEFCMWGWKKRGAYKRKVETLVSHVGCCRNVNINSNNTRTTKKTASCAEVGSGIFEHLL